MGLLNPKDKFAITESQALPPEPDGPDGLNPRRRTRRQVGGQRTEDNSCHNRPYHVYGEDFYGRMIQVIRVRWKPDDLEPPLYPSERQRESGT